MLIRTFRTLVNHCNCSVVLNSNSPKLNTSYTSNLIFFGPILVPKALFASLSRRRLIDGDENVSGHDNTLPIRPLYPTNYFCRLQSNAVSLFKINRVVHWNAPEVSVFCDVHWKTLLSIRWLSRSTRKSCGAFAIKLGSYVCIWMTNRWSL